MSKYQIAPRKEETFLFEISVETLVDLVQQYVTVLQTIE
jgi:hypothetical protein